MQRAGVTACGDQPAESLPVVRSSHLGVCKLFIERPDSFTFTLDGRLTIRRVRPNP